MATEEHRQARNEFRERMNSKTDQIRSAGAGCVVCRETIAIERERRGSVTCSNSCKEALRIRKLDNLKTQKCPHCNHPSSPEEWEMYRKFQRWMRIPGNAENLNLLGRGNPHWEAKAKRYAKVLQDVYEWLNTVIYTAPEDGKLELLPKAVEDIRGKIRDSKFTEVLQPAQKPVDAEPNQ